jgi:AcrR family transcriptional regulator
MGAVPLPTRTRILDAAAELYLERGDHALSMRKVGRRVGVSATAIYRHFPEKAALIEAVVGQAFATFEEFLRRGKPRRGSTGELVRFCRQYLEFAIAHPRLFEVLFLRRRADLRRYPQDFAPGKSPTFDLLREAVEVGIAAGSLRADVEPRELAFAIWTFGHGFVTQYWVGRFGTDLAVVRAQFDRSIRLLLEGFAHETAPPVTRPRSRAARR